MTQKSNEKEVKVHNHKVLSENLLQEVQTKLKTQIQSGLITIKDQPQSSDILNETKPNKNLKKHQNQQFLMKTIEQKRKQTIQKLKQIEEEERQLRKNRKISRSRIINYEKSKHTKEDAEIIKKILKSKQQYDRSLKLKTQNYLKQRQSLLFNEMKEHIEEVTLIKQENKRKAQKSLKELELRKQQRLQMKQKIKINTTQVQNRKYSFLTNIEKEKEKQIEQSKSFEKRLNEIKQSFKLDINEIKAHDNNYRINKKRIQSQKRAKKEKQKNLTEGNLSQSVQQIKQQNFFHKLVRLQREKEEEILRNKKKQAQQRIIKADQFKKYLNQKFRPRLKVQSQSQQQSKINKIQALSNKQLKEIGDKYLKIARKLRKSQQDLLLELPKSIGFNDEVIKKRFKTIVQKNKSKNSTINTFQSDDSKLAYKSVSKDQKLLNSVKNKLQLLKMIV